MAVRGMLHTATESIFTTQNDLPWCLAQCQGLPSWPCTVAEGVLLLKVRQGWVQTTRQKALSHELRHPAFPLWLHGELSASQTSTGGVFGEDAWDNMTFLWRRWGAGRQHVEGSLAVFWRRLSLSSTLYRKLHLIYTLLPVTKPGSPNTFMILN